VDDAGDDMDGTDDMADAEVSVRIEAPPDRVWALIGDPTRMGEWSPECHQVTWAGGDGDARLGARFKGHNRRGWRRWTTTGTIVAFEPGHEIGWDVDFAGFPIARWGYRIEAGADGASCTVVERFSDRRGSAFRVLGPAARGVRDTTAHNRVGMEQTLARVKAAAETATSGA
jgi:uncharacterized protein YndB with AHSA1/START domain